MKILFKILPLLVRFIPIIIDGAKKIFGKEKIDLTSQNYWNPPETEQKAQKATVVFSRPVRSHRLTSSFGPRTLKVDGKEVSRPHYGADYVSQNRFALCYAVEDCRIEKILEPDTKYPALFAKSSDGWRTIAPAGRAWTPYMIAKGVHTGNLYHYKHVKPQYPAGAMVSAGQVLAEYGNLGYSMGAHLHFEVWIGGRPTDPELFFAEKGL